MAAAVIPLVATVAPEIIKLITGLVHKEAPKAEQLGSGTGPVKFAQVFASVVGSLTEAANAGQIPKQLPPDETIKTIVQAVVASLQLSGLLDKSAVATPTQVPAGAQSITLSAGQSVTITVK